MGQAEKQGQHELRQDGARDSLLLRQDDPDEGAGQAVHLPVQSEGHDATVQGETKLKHSKHERTPPTPLLTPLLQPTPSNLAGTCHRCAAGARDVTGELCMTSPVMNTRVSRLRYLYKHSIVHVHTKRGRTLFVFFLHILP